MTTKENNEIRLTELAYNLKELLNKKNINKGECLLELDLLMNAAGIKDIDELD